MPTVRPSRILSFVVLAVALAAFPLGALASHQFSDVPNSNIYHADISALADSGVTTGCGGGNFCPSAFVTREQMAAFMNRLGALGAGKTPVVNAAELDGLDSADFLQAGTIVTHHAGPWLPYGALTSDLTTGFTIGGSFIHAATAGPKATILPIPGIDAIGAASYGLAQLELCLNQVSADVHLVGVEIHGIFGTGDVQLLADYTDTAISGHVCQTYTIPTPAAAAYGVALDVALNFPGVDTDTLILDVTATWVPIP